MGPLRPCPARLRCWPHDRLNSLCDANNELPIRLPPPLLRFAPRVTAAISFSFPFDWIARGWKSKSGFVPTDANLGTVVAIIVVQAAQSATLPAPPLSFRFMINLFVMPNEQAK